MEYLLSILESSDFSLILMIILLFVLVNLLCGVLWRAKRIHQIRKRTGNIILMYEKEETSVNTYLNYYE